MGSGLYNSCYLIMAPCRVIGKYPFRTVSFFYELPQKNGKKNGISEPGVGSRESEVRK